VRRNRTVLGTGVAIALLVAVAVRGEGSTATQDAAAPTPPVTPAPNRRGNGQAVTLAFGGDVHFEGKIRVRLGADPSSVLAGAAPVLEAADLAVVNLETAITGRGTRAPGKQYVFRAPPSAFAALKAGGVDIATMANNHGLDYGGQGLEDSLNAAADDGIPVVGIGRSADEAYRPFLTVVKGQRIAVLGATEVLDTNLVTAWTATDSRPGLASAKDFGRLATAVREARGRADTVVVYLHWGIEGATCPDQDQTELAQGLVDAGADVVIGSHAHRLQGGGRLGGAFVAYGLGNLAFYADSGPATETGVLTLTVTGREVDRFEWMPGRLVGQVPQLLTGTAAERASRAWEKARDCTGLSS